MSDPATSGPGTGNPAICVDASFVARLFVGPDDSRAWTLLEGWLENDAPIYSPTLLVFELTNVFCRYHRAGYLSPATTELVLDAVAELPLKLEHHTSLVKPALRIAAALSLPATYDAYYLALAERYDADLWTADLRLQTAAAGLGVRVKVLGRNAA